MPLIPNPTTAVLEHALRFRNQRQDVIASNIANAETPGYQAFDLLLSDQLGAAAQIGLRSSDPRHIGTEQSAALNAGTTVRLQDPARLDGNNVSLDAEFVKMTENRLMYQTAFELYDGLNALTRVAREVR